jgi:rubrerythrin
VAKEYSSSEIVEMGVQIEKNGRDFYNTVADNSKDEAVKNLFKFLAKEEEKHISAFKNVLSGIESYFPMEAYTEEYFAYLSLLAGENIFTKNISAKDVAKSMNSDVDAISFAIDREKDSILFYYEMQRVVLKDKKGAVEELINQERDHFNKLTKLKGEKLGR